MPSRKPITPGTRFGRWTALEASELRTYASGGKIRFHECRCDCGTVQLVAASKLRSGWSQSCGCLQSERTALANTTHGHAIGNGSRVYNIWCKMIARCTNPRLKEYENYGGRGITVCARWLSSFENFLADMGEPLEELQIDRLNNNGNYEPGNCAWRTRVEQARNRRDNLKITIDGLALTVAEWSQRSGIGRRTIEARHHAGWAVDRILTPPTISRKQK